jgi:hypothetical protein
MNQYFELYSDIEKTVRYVESLCNVSLDEEDYQKIIDSIADGYDMRLTDSEVKVFLVNLMRGKKVFYARKEN